MSDEARVVIRRARLAQLACGLCFAVLLITGLSGVSSFLLDLYDKPIYTGRSRGIHDTTLATLIALEPAIRFIHSWGGYIGILLAGWAGIEVFRAGATMRASGNDEWRRSASWLRPVGAAGAAAIMLSLVLLLASGVAAKAYVDDAKRTSPDTLELRDPASQLVDDGFSGQPAGDQMAEWHIREMNYLLAIGALLLVAAAARIRGISQQARRQVSAEQSRVTET